jgi:capsular polysaccharide biosynthesis protein
VLDVVSQKTGGVYSYAQLRSMVSAAAINETEVFQVTVTGIDYRDAAMIANHIADVLPEKITAIVEGSSVRVVDYAVENPNPVGPNYKKYALLGIVAGFALSVAAIVLADVMDTTIKSEEYLIQAYGKVPLLAVIPGAESSGGYGKKGYRYYKHGYYETEQKRQERKARQKKANDQPNGGSV